MRTKITAFFETLIPFLVLGVAVALLLGLAFVFAYVLIWGLIIGGILWLVMAVKQYFFSNTSKKTIHPSAKDKGRIIEHDDK